MTKKRLSDLLREEADKPEETAENQADETASKLAESAQPQPDSRNSRSRGPTKADLEKQVAELETAVAEFGDREADTAKRTEGLKADLGKQQELIFQLKEKLEKSEAAAKETAEQLKQATGELKAAKKTILQMTAAAKPGSEPQALTEKSDPKLNPRQPVATQVKTSPAAPELQSTAGQRQQLALSSRPPEARPSAARLPAALPRYVAPAAQPEMLTDDEIGWVD
ncbi:MAG: hypothetical protein HC886_20830 [Leptolyngbyaceae cyanobacterium SM1_1_3]|nr:hypothetical protein [Leptolyngbyaceae cyanobacterium SM1_1_3]NJM85172.1 hypothetical protein [Leptolyngbyaceae cyanobacterium RM2_2_21]NJN02998.1 hypothetical protein [Leptolyngbyaceae cyanobacterium RM1_1_2]NJO08352.1 hypothetical protein [Leptolyngbyaceae cyanobacterium SL_1_1]